MNTRYKFFIYAKKMLTTTSVWLVLPVAVFEQERVAILSSDLGQAGPKLLQTKSVGERN